MIFIETKLKGAFIIEIQKLEDERGFFARSWCQQEFLEHGLNPRLVQCDISFNKKRGTLRGMHFQLPPFTEAKLVRCTRGSLYDVIIDIRPGSETFLQWLAEDLSSENYRMLYVPEGFAHGFLTLENNTEVFYQMSQFYNSESARGIRWNDPLFGVDWPIPVDIISNNDQNYKDSNPRDFTQMSLFHERSMANGEEINDVIF
jgi:dTDP-4-dehydrorhamnose 3,5-epimerase